MTEQPKTGHQEADVQVGRAASTAGHVISRAGLLV